jgi:hypothetical protein
MVDALVPIARPCVTSPIWNDSCVKPERVRPLMPPATSQRARPDCSIFFSPLSMLARVLLDGAGKLVHRPLSGGNPRVDLEDELGGVARRHRPSSVGGG